MNDQSALEQLNKGVLDVLIKGEWKRLDSQVAWNKFSDHLLGICHGLLLADDGHNYVALHYEMEFLAGIARIHAEAYECPDSRTKLGMVAALNAGCCLYVEDIIKAYRVAHGDFSVVDKDRLVEIDRAIQQRAQS